ncbi:hypothetical protein C8R46DRAFT_265542 [Mycena filopes]|nr:hypothetical protein C8R46DRAFT_265542 [Mycena filopes]
MLEIGSKLSMFKGPLALRYLSSLLRSVRYPFNEPQSPHSVSDPADLHLYHLRAQPTLHGGIARAPFSTYLLHSRASVSLNPTSVPHVPLPLRIPLPSWRCKTANLTSIILVFSCTALGLMCVESQKNGPSIFQRASYSLPQRCDNCVLLPPTRRRQTI